MLMSKVLIMTLLIGFFNGGGIQTTRISYPNDEVEFEVVRAYYSDGEKITELKVVNYDWEAD